MFAAFLADWKSPDFGGVLILFGAKKAAGNGQRSGPGPQGVQESLPAKLPVNFSAPPRPKGLFHRQVQYHQPAKTSKLDLAVATRVRTIRSQPAEA